MKLNRVPDLIKFFTHDSSKMKIILFLSLDDEISSNLLESLTKLPEFAPNGNSSLAYIYDEAENAEEIFQTFKVEYAPTCLLFNSDYSALGNNFEYNTKSEIYLFFFEHYSYLNDIISFYH